MTGNAERAAKFASISFHAAFALQLDGSTDDISSDPHSAENSRSNAGVKYLSFSLRSVSRLEENWEGTKLSFSGTDWKS